MIHIQTFFQLYWLLNIFQLAQNKGTKAYSQKANQSGDKLGRFIPHKKDTGQVKVTINEDGEEVGNIFSNI